MYSKKFLIEVYMHKFIMSNLISIESLCILEENAYKLYDRVGRDKFRVYASVDAAAIRDYKN